MLLLQRVVPVWQVEPAESFNYRNFFKNKPLAREKQMEKDLLCKQRIGVKKHCLNCTEISYQDLKTKYIQILHCIFPVFYCVRALEMGQIQLNPCLFLPIHFLTYP